jgi:hypothetical protein
MISVNIPSRRRFHLEIASPLRSGGEQSIAGWVGALPWRDTALRRQVLRADWRVIALWDGAAVASARPALLVIPLTAMERRGREMAAAIRALDHPIASIPLVAALSHRRSPTALRRLGFDDQLVLPCSARRVRALIDRWTPDPAAAATLDRLLIAFDEERIVTLAARLHALLGEAIAALATPDAEQVAHRAAGLAGTLGLTAVGAAWLAVSRGGGATAEHARRETRRATTLLTDWLARKADRGAGR